MFGCLTCTAGIGEEGMKCVVKSFFNCAVAVLTTILYQSEAAELYLLMARGSIPLNFDIGKLEAAIKGEL